MGYYEYNMQKMAIVIEIRDSQFWMSQAKVDTNVNVNVANPSAKLCMALIASTVVIIDDMSKQILLFFNLNLNCR
jgi:hypothetical protein